MVKTPSATPLGTWGRVALGLVAIVAMTQWAAGGMATVYLAEDRKHHRKVAVKVLRPELAATLGPERFVREIEIAANSVRAA